MAILYKLLPIKDTINEKPQEGYMAYSVSRGTRNINDLARHMAEGTTFHEAEIKAVLQMLAVAIEHNIKEGYTVNLGELGSFFVSAKSRRVQDKAEIRSHSVKVKRITYRPSRALTHRLRSATFERIPSSPKESEKQVL